MSQYGYTPLRVDYLERAEKNFANYRRGWKASADQYPMVKMERPPVAKGIGLEADITTSPDIRSRYSLTGYGTIGIDPKTNSGEDALYRDGKIIGGVPQTQQERDDLRRQNLSNQFFNSSVSGKSGFNINGSGIRSIGGAGTGNALTSVLYNLTQELESLNQNTEETQKLMDSILKKPPQNVGATKKGKSKKKPIPIINE
tara:strand:- start:197 stop:796 length:600 start_codon:yes stop_codon:yes gene_type:complete